MWANYYYWAMEQLYLARRIEMEEEEKRMKLERQEKVTNVEKESKMLKLGYEKS